MTLPKPNLDDRTYDELVEEARSLIPHFYPEWTNHNPTDPGIILIELLAWLTEMKLYQINRVSDRNLVTFLKLLNGPNWRFKDDERVEALVENGDSELVQQQQTKTLQAATRETLLNLNECYRATTCKDFEYLATHKWNDTPQASGLGAVKRSHCIPLRNLSLADPAARKAIAPGQVSLIIVPDITPNSETPHPTKALRQALWDYLDERRLLTMRHHVVGPRYVCVYIIARLFLQEGVLPNNVRVQAEKDVRKFFHPLTGGQDGKGWPFGRDVYVSEVYQVLEKVRGVDYVEAVRLTTDESQRMNRSQNGTLMSITLHPDELVAVKLDENSFELRTVS